MKPLSKSMTEILPIRRKTLCNQLRQNYKKHPNKSKVDSIFFNERSRHSPMRSMMYSSEIVNIC